MAKIMDTIICCTGTNFLAPNVGWRLSLGLVAVPVLVFFIGSVLLLKLPDSLMPLGWQRPGQAPRFVTAPLHQFRF